MTDHPSQTLIATAPDGTQLTFRTRAGYTVAGLYHGSDGWRIVTKGWSSESVRKRTRTAVGSRAFRVVSLKVKPPRARLGAGLPEVPEEIVRHFERKRQPREAQVTPVIKQVFIKGWADVEDVPATWANIRSLAAQGATTISCQAYGSPYADFPVEPMLRRASFPLLGGALIGSRTGGAR